MSIACRGVLPSRTVLELMRECNPPVGWGRLCPELQAYKARERTPMIELTLMFTVDGLSKQN